MKKIFTAILLMAAHVIIAQPPSYSVANAHAHNDYEKPFPFWAAYNQGFGSIEVDIFLQNGKLIVAHDKVQLQAGHTLDSLYLRPLAKCINKNNGFVYGDTTRSLQLLVDIKTDAVSTLDQLLLLLRSYPVITACQSLQIVISGNRPAASEFVSYPGYIHFDGVAGTGYSDIALTRIAMLSDNFKNYSSWNGKGRIPQAEQMRLDSAIRRAHQLHKKIRFWNAPDMINSWYAFMKMGVDYINTDQVGPISVFFNQLPDRTYTAPQSYNIYKPRYRNDGLDKPVKNILLFIGDGTGLAELYAGYTANKGALNIFSMHFSGLSKTSSYDNFITDSAPGATAISSGEKTNNRAVGVDPAGKPLTLLTDIFSGRKMATGIITSGDMTDATPAAFYAHQSERSHSLAILKDLVHSPLDLLVGMGSPAMTDSLSKELAKQFLIVSSVEQMETAKLKKYLVADKVAGLSMLNGRGNWAQQAFTNSVSILSRKPGGFFLMFEGAQIDHGGHANQLPWLTAEVMDFDKVIGKAMEFADSNGETLIIVTADHETGGLSLTGGDYKTGYISGQFSTEDHTAIPVPVFAYGPQAQFFSGVYENTALFYKILQAIGYPKTTSK